MKVDLRDLFATLANEERERSSRHRPLAEDREPAPSPRKATAERLERMALVEVFERLPSGRLRLRGGL
jgi:hypothetical protein